MTWATRPEPLPPAAGSHDMTVLGAVTEGLGCRQCVERLRKGTLLHNEGLLYIFKPAHFFRSVIF